MVSDRIGLISINCNFHAEELAQKVFQDPSCYFSGYDRYRLLASDRVPYVIGFFSNNRTTLEAHYDLIDLHPGKNIIHQRPALIHWVGTDIMNAKTLFDIGERRMFEKLSHGAIINLVHTEEHLEEMKRVMPLATYMIVPLPPYIIHDVTPFEEHPMISVYMPTMRQEFFRKALIVKAAERFPEVRFEFYYYYDEIPQGELPVAGTINCFYVTSRDAEGMKEQVRRSRAFIRVPEHDGLSVQALEYATAGRSVIYNKHLPFIYEVKLEGCTDQEQAIQELCRHITAALERTEPNQKMADYYRKEYGHEKYIDRIEQALNSLPQPQRITDAVS